MPKPPPPSPLNPFAGLINALIYVGDAIMASTQDLVDAANAVAKAVNDTAAAVAPLPDAVNALEQAIRDALSNSTIPADDQARIDEAVATLRAAVDTATSTAKTAQDAATDAMDGIGT